MTTTYEQARADAASTAAALEHAWERPGAETPGTRADGACTCGGHADQQSGLKRGDAGTVMRRDATGREHIYRLADYPSEAAIDDEIAALNRVIARCGTGRAGGESPRFCK